MNAGVAKAASPEMTASSCSDHAAATFILLQLNHKSWCPLPNLGAPGPASRPAALAATGGRTAESFAGVCSEFDAKQCETLAPNFNRKGFP
jgi:hypothetical protein